MDNNSYISGGLERAFHLMETADLFMSPSEKTAQDNWCRLWDEIHNGLIISNGGVDNPELEDLATIKAREQDPIGYKAQEKWRLMSDNTDSQNA